MAIPQYRDEIPAFRSDGTRLPPNPPDPASNKACLEPYRQASMAIFRLIREWCASFGEGILLEKGGLDEAFIDITEEVEQLLIDEFDQKYTMLKDELEDLGDEELESEAIENLKLYDISWIEEALDFTGLGENAITKESSNLDIDIVERMKRALGKLRIWKGAKLAKDLRAKLRSDLNFIASIGIASNKMLAKLVSALYKPDKQTRLEPDGVETFMKQVPFEKIRMMGGKMGKSVLLKNNEANEYDNESEEEESDTEPHEDSLVDNSGNSTQVMASDLWPLSVSELAERVGDRQTAIWIHQLIRGLDPSPVTPRSLTKSFMSAKSFRPSVRDWPELHDWVVVLVGELWSRMAEEKECSGRWPSTITIHFKAFSKQNMQNKNNTWSNTGAITKSCEFPYSSSIPSQATRSDFLSAVFKLLSANPSLFPMSRLAVSVTNFKGLEADGKARATRVDQFFKKKQTETTNEADTLFESTGLDRFFTQKGPEVQRPVVPVVKPAKKSVFELLVNSAKQRDQIDLDNNTNVSDLSVSTPTMNIAPSKKSKTDKKQPKDKGILKFFKSPQSLDHYTCIELNCNFSCPKEDAKSIQEHSDHHLAIKLSRE